MKIKGLSSKKILTSILASQRLGWKTNLRGKSNNVTYITDYRLGSELKDILQSSSFCLQLLFPTLTKAQNVFSSHLCLSHTCTLQCEQQHRFQNALKCLHNFSRVHATQNSYKSKINNLISRYSTR